MLYETLSHPSLFVVFAICGIVCGFVFDVGYFTKKMLKNNIIFETIIDFVITSLSLCMFYVTNLEFNYGEHRIFPFFITLLLFFIYKITLSKILRRLRSSNIAK